MKSTTTRYIALAFVVTALLCCSREALAITAEEILERAAKEGLGESFRIVVAVKAFKGKKLISKHLMWLMGTMEDDTAKFFLDFDEPEESKGLRFLLILAKDQQAQAFMYLPATKRTVPVAADDPGVDLGGTGLTMEDVSVFAPKGGEKAELVGEEKAEGRECYKIKIAGPDKGGERLLWVSKKDLFVVKTVNANSKGKIDRSFKVVKYFKTAKGREFPREEEINIPERDVRIQLRQENAVFGITIPEELLEPKSFGTYKWRD